MAISASMQGWRHCRPIISIDGTFLTGHFKGCMLIACTLDVNNKIFPLAMALVDSENDESYEWFLGNLRRAYGIRDDLVIVSDRHSSIQRAVLRVFPEVFHGFCVFHLVQNLKTRFHTNGVTGYFKLAALAYRKEDFERNMRELDSLNPAARAYLEEVGFDRWARSLAPRSRYQLMTTNISESLNNVFKDVKSEPVVTIAEAFRNKCQEWFNKQREFAISTVTTLAASPEKILRLRCNLSGAILVSFSIIL